MTLTRDSFDPLPSLRREDSVSVRTTSSDLDSMDALGIPVAADLDVAGELGVDRAALRRAGFLAKVGQTLAVPRTGGPAVVAVGVGDSAVLDTAALRNAAAAFARAVPEDARLGFHAPALATGSPRDAAEAVVEGVLLARYSFDLRGKTDLPTHVDELRLLVDEAAREQAEDGARRGRTIAAATELSRDLASGPGSLLTAVKMADAAVELAARGGLTAQVFDRTALTELGCGGLLGVNQASAEEPRMVRLHYTPASTPSGHLALVGKGITYDSGGISLKPSDAVHATMKNDMTGAAGVLASMSVLRDLGCTAEVTGYLMCTDNMPSGSALRLGDVITMHGGRTVEVLNTDAEGRLVMADALVMAAESGADAIVDIATLTGACMRALGTEVAGVFGSSQPLVDQIEAAAATTDEPVWQLPLDYRYRNQLDSTIADLTNMGGPNAGATTAALFLAEFVGDVPWAHLDIAGTAQADAPRGWITKGPTGFGARLLVELALNFTPPSS